MTKVHGAFIDENTCVIVGAGGVVYGTAAASYAAKIGYHDVNLGDVTLLATIDALRSESDIRISGNRVIYREEPFDIVGYSIEHGALVCKPISE